ncbi:MAG: hypothetical protein GY761_00005, partial [Hyphomicrobiales bacterium]|nr:hypothetical protein [Hyphomicrobiales bacterium]
MADLIDIPLVSEWLSFSEGKQNSSALFSDFVQQNLTAGNVDVPGSTATAIYSGQVNGKPAYQIANDLADRSGGQLRILDKTDIGKFLLNILDEGNSEARSALGFEPETGFVDHQFEAASAKFAIETKGPVITITPEANEFRMDGSKVTYSAVEVDNLLKSGATTINGRPLAEIKADVDKLGGPDSNAGRAFAKSQFDGDFARIVAQGTDNSLQIGPRGAALDLDADTRAKLGIGNLSFDPASGAITSPQSSLTDSLKASAARGLAAETAFLGSTDNPAKALSAVGLDLGSESAEFRAIRDDVVQGIDKLESDDWRVVRNFDGLVDKVKNADIKFFAGWASGLFEKFKTSSVDVFKNATDDIKGGSVRLLDTLKRFSIDDNGTVRIPELSSFKEVTPDIAGKALGLAGAAAFGILKFHTAAVKYGGTGTPEFQDWLKGEAIGAAIGLPIAAGALYMAAGSPLGMAVLIGGGALLTYFEVKGIVQDIVDNKDKYADGSLIVSFAEGALSIFEFIEKKFEPVIQMGARIIEAFAEGLEIAVIKLAELALPEMKLVGGIAADFVSEEGEWLIGFDAATLIGSTANDTLIHTGAGEVLGLSGDDILVGLFPDYIEQGTAIGAEPAEGEEDTRPVAETNLRLTLNGGEGDDYLIALGGTGAILVGGEGRDFLFNTSFKGQMYGDTIDGVGQSTSGTEDSDVFWYWPSTFIMDAQPNDILQMFGWPLLGGSNSVAGIYAGDG